jgi:hypothetical protein
MTFTSARRTGMLAAATTAVFATAMPASAAVTLRITATNDAAFENQGGSLQTYYNLANPSAPGGTVLPPLERAVGQIKMGANKRRGLYLPAAATGTPVADGGTGVFSALTNAGAYASNDNDFTSGAPLAFSFSRTGNVVSLTIGNDTFTGDARASMLDINAFEFRVRSNATSVSAPSNSILFSNLVYNDDITVNQSLGSFGAADGAVNIGVWDGIVGDFSIAGNFTASWSGTRPGGAALATQLKLLSVPLQPTTPIPEPASWALLIAGFGLTGATMRRRRRVAA